MGVDDIKRNIIDNWGDHSTYWNDDMSRKFEMTIIEEVYSLLDDMNKISDDINRAQAEALFCLQEIVDNN